MREAGSLNDEKKAKLLADYLIGQGIDCEIDQASSGDWQIWIIDDARIEEAERIFDEFRNDPDNPLYISGAQKAAAVRAEKAKEEKEAAKLERTRDDLFRGSFVSRMGPVTLTLAAISIVVTIIISFSASETLLQALSIAKYRVIGGYVQYMQHLHEVRHGQIWRLVTPIFMHFGPLHILFNMMWLMDLGNMLEKIRSSRFLLLFVLVTAAVSNTAQFYVGGPSFGGMSGVVYALLGFVWMQSKFNPWSPFVLHQVTVQMMLIWLVLGFMGVIGNMANFAHLGGLVAGVAWGYLDAKRKAGH